MGRQDIKFTYADYCLLPEESRYELIEGELLMTPSPTLRHQSICTNLEFMLVSHVRKYDLGVVLHAPMDVKLSEHNVVQPDILFIAKERLGITTEHYVAAAPDLVVEVLSPGTRSRDIDIKKRLYGKYGVQEYWIVDPEANSVEVLHNSESGLEIVKVFSRGQAFASIRVPGLQVEVDEVFRG